MTTQDHELLETVETTDSNVEAEIEQILEDFVDVGRMWAHHGVTIGTMAMKSSARTFEVTAGALGTIARHLAPAKESDPVQ
jgi:hypothetical protein